MIQWLPYTRSQWNLNGLEAKAGLFLRWGSRLPFQVETSRCTADPRCVPYFERNDDAHRRWKFLDSFSQSTYIMNCIFQHTITFVWCGHRTVTIFDNEVISHHDSYCFLWCVLWDTISYYVGISRVHVYYLNLYLFIRRMLRRNDICICPTYTNAWFYKTLSTVWPSRK